MGHGKIISNLKITYKESFFLCFRIQSNVIYHNILTSYQRDVNTIIIYFNSLFSNANTFSFHIIWFFCLIGCNFFLFQNKMFFSSLLDSIRNDFSLFSLFGCLLPFTMIDEHDENWWRMIMMWMKVCLGAGGNPKCFTVFQPRRSFFYLGSGKSGQAFRVEWKKLMEKFTRRSFPTFEKTFFS